MDFNRHSTMTPVLKVKRVGIDLASDTARRFLYLGTALATSEMLCGCKPALLDPKGPIGHADRTILIDSLVIMLAIVIPTICATFAFAWWFRASNHKSKYLPDWEFSGQLEMIVWAIPILTIVLLGGVTWIGAHELDPAKPIKSSEAALEVQVVSLDWKWLFIYPDQGVASVNQLVVPIGRPLHFTLTSSSVMNTFFVPKLGSMIYVMNGMATELYLQADEVGSYRGISGHYSGEGFSDMHFNVSAVTSTEFSSWVDKTRKDGSALDSSSYLLLAKQSINLPASTFSSVQRDLFGQIVTQQLAPGPGPETRRQGISANPRIKS